MRTFEDKVAIIASAFYNRFDEQGEPEILQKIFGTHDMSGAIALSLANGDIELKSEEPVKWLEDTFDVLNAVFDFPDSIDEMVKEEAEVVEKPKPKPRKKTANS